MHKELMACPVIQADETPVEVSKDGRSAGSKSYMWVYRTGKLCNQKPMVLYEYQQTRKIEHPKNFLKDYSGILVTDGYQVYHSLERDRDNLIVAGCWSLMQDADLLRLLRLKAWNSLKEHSHMRL